MLLSANKAKRIPRECIYFFMWVLQLKQPRGGLLVGMCIFSFLMLGIVESSYGQASHELQSTALRTDIQARVATTMLNSGKSQVNVFIASNVEDLDIQTVRVFLDGKGAAQYSYNHEEASALKKGAYHHVATLLMEPGDHEISSIIIARNFNEKASEVRYTEKSSEVITVAANISNLSLALVEKKRFGVMKRVAVESKMLTVVDGEHWLRSAQFWELSGRHFSALSDVGYREKIYGHSEKYVQNIANQDQSDSGTETIIEEFNSAILALVSGDDRLLLSFVESEIPQFGRLMLRDRANLILGYYYLNSGRHKSSAERFADIRRHSPYANRALIGLGWSKITPRDKSSIATADDPYRGKIGAEYLWSDSEDYIAWARRRTPFRNAWSQVSAHQREEVVNAMAPWMELVSGDPLDPAVQEAMVIVPYTLLHMGSYEVAIKRYDYADKELRLALIDIQSALDRVANGKMRSTLLALLFDEDNGWSQWLGGVDEHGSEAYILSLLSDPRFLQAIESIKPLADIRNTLNRHRSILLKSLSLQDKTSITVDIDNVVEEIDQEISVLTKAVEAVATTKLKEDSERTESYLAEVHFALARLAERRFADLAGASR